MSLGSGIQNKPIPDPGSSGQKGTGSRIRNTAVATVPLFFLSQATQPLSLLSTLPSASMPGLFCSSAPCAFFLLLSLRKADDQLRRGSQNAVIDIQYLNFRNRNIREWEKFANSVVDPDPYVFLGLLDSLVRGTDPAPEPSIIKHK